MIIKIVHNETVGKRGLCAASLAPEMVEELPRQIVLIDGVDEVEYEKVACDTAGQLMKLVSEFGFGLNDIQYGPELPFSDEEECQSGGIQSVLMNVRRSGGTECVVAVNSAVYFMNENGKTVDKVVCR